MRLTLHCIRDAVQPVQCQNIWGAMVCLLLSDCGAHTPLAASSLL
jgi:hypothetical protein